MMTLFCNEHNDRTRPPKNFFNLHLLQTNIVSLAKLYERLKESLFMKKVITMKPAVVSETTEDFFGLSLHVGKSLFIVNGD